jgi:PKD repeat protein
MEPTSILVHNYEGTLDVTVWTDPDPPEGSVPCEIEFNCQVNNGTKPYAYEWDFDDGETFEETNDGTSSLNHIYTEEGSYDVTIVITDSDGDTSSVYIEDISVHPGPIAAFTWFDADGPYGSGKFICCNASVSSYSGDSATFKWYKDSGSVSIGTGSVLYHDLGDENIHNIKLNLTDKYGNYDIHTEQVQANSLNPVKLDSKPWVLAGKAIYPDNDSDTFQSYTAGYYVKYTSPKDAPLGVRIFEVREKTNTEQPVLDIGKIVNLASGHYNESYSNIKSALGLVSDRAMYNFRIRITIYNESGTVDDELIFGASDNNALAKASTTRQVLVYYPPTAKEGNVSAYKWVINSHPKYKQAEITITILLGGTPPEYKPQ